MARGGPLSKRAAASLLIAAGIIDLVFLGILAVILAELGDDMLRPLPPGARLPAVFLVLVVLHLFLTEVALDGRSVGRGCLGLRMRDQKGGRVGLGRRLRRALEKSVCLGIAGINPTGLAFYNRDTSWTSPIAPRRLRPIETWELCILRGGHAGERVELRTLGKKARGPLILIGRDKSRAHLVLSRDTAVDDVHCQLAVNKGRLYLRDGDGSGAASKTGTFIEKKRLTPQSWEPLGTKVRQFRVANVLIEIDRI